MKIQYGYTWIIDCDVIQAEGGTRAASISGGYVTLTIAINKMINSGAINLNPIKTMIVSVSVGISSDNLLLNLCYEEYRKADIDINVTMNSNCEYIDIQGTAERETFSRFVLEEMLKLVSYGIDEILLEQKMVIIGLGVDIM